MATKKREKSEMKADEPDEGKRLLREDAEEQLVRSPKFSNELKDKTPEKLIHELQVHQIELEMQAEELRKAKSALEESRDRFLDLYDFAPIGYLTLSEKGLIVEVNLTVATLLGVDRSRLLKARFSKYIAEKDVEVWHWYFINVLNQDEKKCCTLTLIRRDGSYFPARLESLRNKDSSKGTLTVRMAVSDISDIRKAEEVQQNQYSLLKGIQESTDSAIFSLDCHYRYTSFNSHHANVMKQIYGADIETGKSIFDYQSVKEDQVKTKINIDRALAGETFVELAFSGEETRLRRYFEVSHCPVKDINNMVVGVAVFAQDITNRKRAEDAVLESEERYRRITEGLTDYLYTVRVQDGKAVSTMHGAACVEVTGYTAEEFAADPYLWIRMVFDEDRNFVIHHVNTVLKGKSVPPVEHRIVRKDGQIRWVRDTPIIQLDADGRLVSYDGVIKDITAAKQAEVALQKNTDALLTSFNKLTSSEENLRQTIEDLGRSERALRESERTYRNLYEYAQVGLFETSLINGNVIACNEQYATLAGFSSVKDAIGKDIVHLYANPDDRKEVSRILHETGHIDDHIVQFKNHQTGRLFWAQFSARINKKKDAAEGTIIDISELKRIEQELSAKHEELMASYEHATASEEELKSQFEELSVIQEDLIKSEERFRLTLDATNDGIWDWNVSKGTTFFSPHWYTMLGYESGEMPASHTTWRSLIHPDDLGPTEQKMKDHIRTHVGYVVEVRMRTKQGDWRWILSRGRVIEQDKDGFPVRVIGTHTDITDRKRAEVFRQLSADVLGILSDPAELPEVVGRVLAAIKRVTNADAVGIRLKTGDDFPYFVENGFSNDFLLKENTLVARDPDGGICRDSKGNVSLECTCGLVISGKTDPDNPLFTSGGSSWTNNSFPFLKLPEKDDPRYHPRNTCIHMGYASVALIPIRKSQQQIIGILQINAFKKDCFTPDIIQSLELIAGHIGEALMRKQAEKGLRESEEKYRTYIDNSPEAIFIVDAAGNYRDANPSACSMLGYSRKELISLSIRDLVPAGTLSSGPSSFLKLQETGRINTEAVLVKKNGDLLPVILNAVELPGKRYLGFCTDITNRKLTEDTLMRVNQKLNVLSDLTRKDLSSQIFVLRSYVELAKKNSTGKVPVLESLQKIERVVKSINDISEISKDYQDMGTKPPSWQNVNMALLFGLSHISIAEIQHTLETENLEIFADPLLEKAFQGIFENSIAHGTHVSRIRISHTETPAGLVICYEDDGVGIPAERKDRIFFRGEGSRTSVRGLFFVREILDITGITIKETGEPGKGARFEMTVPKGAWRISGNGT